MLDTLGSYHPCRNTTISWSILACDVYEGFQRKEETTVVAHDLEDAHTIVNYTTLLMLMLEGSVDTCRAR